MVLRGYRQWDQKRKASEDAVEHLDIERLHRNGAFPSGLSAEGRLDLVLQFLRDTPWAKSRIWRRTKRVPQGSFLTLKCRGAGDTCVDVLAFVLSLQFSGLEMTPEGGLRLQFEADPADNCQSAIVVELDTTASSFGAHRFRSDANAGLDGVEDQETIKFVGEQLGKSVVAAWEETNRQGYQLHLLWSDGRISSIRRDDDTIWINVVEDLRHVVNEAPFGSAIAVIGGK